MFMLKIILLFCALLIIVPAHADIYKHVDEQGNVTFTNTPLKGAQRIFVEQSAAPLRAVKPRGSESTVRTPSISPSAFPRVNPGTQKERDVSRRHILEEELASEQRLLSSKKKELADANTTRSVEEMTYPQKYIERLGRLRENVLLHEKNIVALQTELSKVR